MDGLSYYEQYSHSSRKKRGLNGAPSVVSQSPDNVLNVVVLKEADGGDAGGSVCEAGWGVGECDSSEGQDRDFGFAGFAECGQASWACIFFFEDWSEDGERRTVGGGPDYFFRGVTGDCDLRFWW